MRYIFVLVIINAFLVSCKDYLDLVPEKDILTIDAIFEQKKTALTYLTSAYQGVTKSKGSIVDDPAICGGDEFVTNEFSRNTTYSVYRDSYIPAFKIAEGKMTPADPILGIWGPRDPKLNFPYSDKYIMIRYCNTFIQKVDDVFNMTEEEKRRYKAIAIAAKAWYYFELIKFYGPIVLVPENMAVNSKIEQTQIPRSNVDECFKRVVDLFDQAIPHLRTFNEQPSNEKAYFNKEAAMAYKAKALLYAASPLFNGNDWYGGMTNKNGEPLFSTSYDNSKWEKAAIALDEAIAFCESTGRSLTSGTSSESTSKLNVIRDIQNSVTAYNFQNSEIIFGIWSLRPIDFKVKLPRYSNGKHPYYTDNAYGNLSPSMRMVEMFYTENGLPLQFDKTWNYQNRYVLGSENDLAYSDVVMLNSDVINLHLKREPRFYANVAGHNMYWKRGVNNIVMDPLRDGTHGTTEISRVSSLRQNIGGYWCKKFVPHDLDPKDNKNLVVHTAFPAMRLADLYLMQAEAWNEFSGPSQKVYNAIDKIRLRAGIPTLQAAWNSYSKDPARITTKGGLREVIHQERMIEFAFEGHRFWDLRRWKTAHVHQNEPIRGWNILGDNDKVFYNSYNGPIHVWTKNKFNAPRDYFWPIRSQEVLVGNIKQNLGW